MALRRQLEQDLLKWSRGSSRKPLLLRGARQVGKSYLVETFGAQHFDHVLTINFEVDPDYKRCFETLKPQEICDAITVLSQQSITPGETLLFLDEIQDCPQAIRALRYFKEQMPELHVIAAGSLLELTLSQADFRMPVGRVSFLYLYPLSFKEFLWAFNEKAVEAVETATVENPLSEAIHVYLLKQLKLYLLLGGMPESVSHYQENGNFQDVQAIQSGIIETYEKDFGHYASVAEIDDLKVCFKQVPLMIGQQIKYNKVDPDLRSHELKRALSALEDASILHRVHATSAQGLPLDATLNEKKFKLNFIDVGLVKRFNQLDAQLILNEDIMLLNRGALAEQFVGQELLAYFPPYEKTKLYFWARDQYGTAEIDYVAIFAGKIYPIEVKAGSLGKMRSMQQYLKEHPSQTGIRLSERPLKKENNVLTVPLYMISELNRLYKKSLISKAC